MTVFSIYMWWVNKREGEELKDKTTPRTNRDELVKIPNHQRNQIPEELFQMGTGDQKFDGF